MIVKKKVFGKVISYVYTIEFQKRGLPHAHLLITLHPDNKIITPDDVDKHICAEIPLNNKQLQKLVIKHMLHGPHDSKSPCLDDKKICKKKFPKKFTNQTSFTKNGYPEYKRNNNSNDNRSYKIKNSNIKIFVDNSMVVPYNKFLLMKYNCHINVECCASIQSIKYIFDYIHKGSDRAFCKLKKETDKDNEEIYDEITQYIDGRYLSPMEAAWRLQEFPLCGRSHTVFNLPVPIENKQKIVFEESKINEALTKWKTPLTAWFELNKLDSFANSIKYINIPQYYTFDPQTKQWNKRKRLRKNIAIGRLNVVSPKDQERFYLKLILNKVKGKTSFDDLKTFENKTYTTFKDTAIAMGLVEHDSHIEKIFEEACTVMLPSQLRKFFAWFLISENCQGNIIWNK